MIALAALAALVPVAAFAPPLALSGAATLVVALVAVSDIRPYSLSRG
ncbi:MAG: hypothetical protein JWN52_6403 [Actinomycetia bacterium]|nr:hypothetical protein [Actinomycetes bacterium]